MSSNTRARTPSSRSSPASSRQRRDRRRPLRTPEPTTASSAWIPSISPFTRRDAMSPSVIEVDAGARSVALATAGSRGRTITAPGHDAAETPWWFDGRGVDDAALWAAPDPSNCSAVVIELDQQHKVSTQKQCVVHVGVVGQLEQVRPGSWVVTPSEEIRVAAREAGFSAGLLLDIENLEQQFPHCVEVCERG